MSSLPSGGQPFEVLAADLNGDGHLDLAVTNSTDSTIGVFLGNGEGTFGAQTAFPTGAFPRGLVAADFNRDGIIDLAAAATNGPGMAVHLGQGGGRFGPPRLVSSGQRPFHAVTADFNTDGVPDIAVANEAHFVSVLLGDGRGGFSRHNYDTGKKPSNVVAADFNEDGYLDLAATNWDSNTVAVLFGTGDGATFSGPKLFTYAGHGLFALIAPDLDRDGHADMVWNDLASSSMYILYGDGRGDFPRTDQVPTGGGVRSIRAVDLNGDGWLDLVSADTAANDVSVALADGHGTFQPTQHVPVGIRPRVVTTGDFDGDGRPDVAVSNMTSNTVTVLLNRGLVPVVSQSFDPGPQQTRRILEFPDLEAPNAIVVAQDGDLIVSDQQHNRIVRVARDSGAISPLAGTGQSDFQGDGGPAAEASFRLPAGLALDPAGNLYVADSDNNRVRRIDRSGLITTVAGTGEAGFAGDGGPATNAQLNRPYSLALDPSGALYASDLQNLRIRRIDRSGQITTVVGSGVVGYGGDGGPATAALLGLVTSVVVDPQGTLFIADKLNRVVRKVDTSGRITTVAGGKRAGSDGDIGMPAAIAVDAHGTVVFAADTRIARLTGAGAVEIIAEFDRRQGSALQGTPSGLAVAPDATLYAVDPGAGRVVRIDRVGAMTAIDRARPDSSP